jgi:hypothetical protein
MVSTADEHTPLALAEAGRGGEASFPALVATLIKKTEEGERGEGGGGGGRAFVGWATAATAFLFVVAALVGTVRVAAHAGVVSPLGAAEEGALGVSINGGEGQEAEDSSPSLGKDEGDLQDKVSLCAEAFLAAPNRGPLAATTYSVGLYELNPVDP